MRKLSDKIKREKGRFCYVNDDGSFNTECYLRHFAGKKSRDWQWLLNRYDKWYIDNIETVVAKDEDIIIKFVEEKLNDYCELVHVTKYIDGIHHDEHVESHWLMFQYISYDGEHPELMYGFCPFNWAGLVYDVSYSEYLNHYFRNMFLEIIDKFGQDYVDFLEVKISNEES